MGLLSWSMAKCYDAVMRNAETASLGGWRRELLNPLAGDILEVGAGTGVNLDYYSDSVASLTLSEPDRHMRAQLSKRLATVTIAHQIIDAPAETIPCPDHSFDAAVVTLVLCSVNHPEKSLSELYRVLKPGGKLALIEHVGAPDQQQLFTWQKRIEPLWKRCAGNCHLTRDTLSTLRSAGFHCQGIRHDTMRGGISIAAPTILGIAEKS